MTNDLPDYFDLNLTALKQHHPVAYQTVMQAPEEMLGDVVRSSNGQLNLKVTARDGRSIYLHAADNPSMEVPQFLNMVPDTSTGVVIHIGMGLGYAPAAILREREQIRHLVVFEMEPGIFRQALRCMDLVSFLSDRRLVLCIGNDFDMQSVFAPIGRALMLESIHTLKHLPSFSYDSAAYETLSEQVYGFANSYNMEGATMMAHGKDFLGNRLSFLSMIHHNCLLESLKGAFEGVPAIVVAGGPSLDKNCKLLAEAKGRAVIISVDTVLPKLMSQGILPDFVTSIDYKPITYEKIADVASEMRQVNLICSSWVASKIPKTVPADNVFWTFTGKGMEIWLNSVLGGKYLTNGAGTVAHLNFIAATMMACSPIVFVGQDLAYSGDRGHAADIVLTTKDRMKRVLQSEKEIPRVKGIDGGMIPTSRQLYNHKRSFEAMISTTPNHYINATEGGAHIEGTDVRTLRDVIDTFCLKEQNITLTIDSKGGEAKLSDTKKLLSELQAMQAKIRKLRRLIRKSDKLSMDVQAHLQSKKRSGRPYTSYAGLPSRIQQKVNEIDACHQKIDQAKKVWQLLDEITLEGLKESERMLYDISLLEGDPQQYMLWLEKNIERLTAINQVRKEVLLTFEKFLIKTLSFHRGEKRLQNIVARESTAENMMALARLYMEEGNYSLAQPILTRVKDALPESAEVNYALGVIAAMQSLHKESDQYFKQALKTDPKIRGRIGKFRRQMGDEYMSYYRYLKDNDAGSARTMIAKGLRVCKDHPKLLKELNRIGQKDRNRIQKALTAGEDCTALDITTGWHATLEKHTHLIGDMDPSHAGELCRLMGHVFAQANRLVEAQAYYQQAIDRISDQPPYYLFLADVLFMRDEYSAGIKYLVKAVELDRRFAYYWERMGDNLAASRQIKEAIAAYEQCFLALPERVDLLKKIGDCHLAADNLAAAREAYAQLKCQLKKAKKESEIPTAPDFNSHCIQSDLLRSAAPNDLSKGIEQIKAYCAAGDKQSAEHKARQLLDKHPEDSMLLHLLGTIVRSNGDLPEAESFVRLAVKYDQSCSQYHQSLGDILQLQDRRDEALVCYQKSLELDRGNYLAHLNKGKALQDMGAFDKALACYQKALSIKPDYPEAYYNAGIIHKSEGRINDAIECYNKCLAMKPEMVHAHNNLGNALQAIGRLSEAVACYQKALELNPRYIEAHNNLGAAYQDMGRKEEAVACYRKLLEVDPECPATLDNLVDQGSYLCDWQTVAEFQPTLDRLTEKALQEGRKPGEIPLNSLKRHDDPERNYRVAKLHAQEAKASLSQEIQRVQTELSASRSRCNKKRLTIGYLSNDFRNHAVSHIMAPVFKHHDRSAFEIICYSYGSDDQSRYRTMIRDHCDKFVDVRDMSYADAARRIYQDHVDILLEMNGYTHSSRMGICAFRPAPVQAAYLGFLGTTGTDFIDYIIADRLVIPDSHVHWYAETPVYLPDCYQVTDYSSETPGRSWTRRDVGLPEGAVVFCSFNQPYKIEPVMFSTWMNILKRTEKSVLWLGKSNPTAEANLKAEAASLNIDPARLIFSKTVSLGDHLSRLSLADIALDTRIYNGGATTSNALWAGIPVISLLGSHFVSRMSSSSLTALGVQELICRSLAEYEALAVRLAAEPDELEAIRKKIAVNRHRSSLFDVPRFVRNLEDACRQMWAHHEAGNRVDYIDVAEKNEIDREAPSLPGSLPAVLSKPDERADRVSSKRLFFVCGAPKSGTTWLQRLLDAHPQIVCSGEGHFIGKLSEPLVQAFNAYNYHYDIVSSQVYEGKPYYRKLGQDCADFVIRQVAFAQMGCREISDTIQCVGDKTPFYCLKLPELTRIFPGGRIIHIVRDGRDAAVSQLHHAHRAGIKNVLTPGSENFMAQFSHAAVNWKNHVEQARQFGRTYADRYMEIRYEDLLDDPEDVIRQVFSFLSVDTKTVLVREAVAQASFSRITGREQGEEDKNAFVRKGIAKDWKNYFNPDVLSLFLQLTGTLLEDLGYLDSASDTAAPSWAGSGRGDYSEAMAAAD